MVGRLMFLVDSNVWLELLLEQQKADEVRQFLEGVDAAELAISEFSLYSIAIILCRFNKDDVLEDFLSDTLAAGGVSRICLDATDLKRVVAARRRFQMDFDDAYQYVAAAKHGYTLVSFDKDFDRTDRGRKTPAEAVGV